MYPISSDPNDSDTQSSSFLYRPATHPTKLREPERRTCSTSDTLREGGTNQTIVLESLVQREKLVAGPRSSEKNSQSCRQGQSGNRVLNTLVVIKDDHLPPLKWRLRRVLELVPAKNGVARVATVRTAAGLLQRTVARLCPLHVLSAKRNLYTIESRSF